LHSRTRPPSMSSSGGGGGDVSTILSMVAVGALWGCTNPFLRKGAVDSDDNDRGNANGRASTMGRLLNVSVWLPFVLNQMGSFLFYALLGQTELTMAGPFCNGISLVFSFIASNFLGEATSHPWRAVLGSSFVVVGVTICMMDKEGSIGSDDDK